MKNTIFLLLAVLVIAVSASAVTALLISQIKSTSTTTGAIALTPPGTAVPVWGVPGAGLSISPTGVVSAAGAVGPTGPQGQTGATGAIGPAGPALSLPTPATGEVMGGTVNGTNAVFTLANPPVAGWPIYIYRNGLRLNLTNGDYTILGQTVTFAAGQVPQTGDSSPPNVDYWH